MKKRAMIRELGREGFREIKLAAELFKKEALPEIKTVSKETGEYLKTYLVRGARASYCQGRVAWSNRIAPTMSKAWSLATEKSECIPHRKIVLGSTCLMVATGLTISLSMNESGGASVSSLSNEGKSDIGTNESVFANGGTVITPNVAAMIAHDQQVKKQKENDAKQRAKLKQQAEKDRLARLTRARDEQYRRDASNRRLAQLRTAESQRARWQQQQAQQQRYRLQQQARERANLEARRNMQRYHSQMRGRMSARGVRY